MQPTIKDILRTLESLAPASLAEKWDNVGLLVGSTENSASGILIGLDPTNTLIDEAIALGADTIITHHPVIFKPLSAIDTSDPVGRLLQKTLSHNISIIACHTNLDSAVNGVNDILASGLGLSRLEPLQPIPESGAGLNGLGRIGSYPQPLPAKEFLRRLFELLHLETLNIAGSLPETISTVAVCGGSGSDLAPLAHDRGADVYLSAEIKHSTAIWANESGFAVIDGTHYATEKPVTFYLADKLREIAAEQNWQSHIYLSETEVPPFVSLHTLLPLKKNHNV
jgi:dinuclear metal center YbgI/SA1388 family protein